MHNRITTFLLIFLVSVGLIAVVWIWWNAQQAKNMSSAARAKASGAPIPVRTETVKTKTYEEIIGAAGVSAASKMVSIKQAFSGDRANSGLILEEVHAFEGKRLSKGDLLFVIQAGRFETELAAAVAGLEAAELSLQAAEQSVSVNKVVRSLEIETARENLVYRKNDLNRLKDDYNRMESLAKKSALVATIDLTQAFSLVAEAQAELTKADSTLKLLLAQDPLGPLQDKKELFEAQHAVKDAERELDVAQRNLTAARIESPIDGLVGPVNVVAGQVLDLSSELTQVYSLDPIFINANVPIDRLHSIELGQEAQVDIDGFPDKSFSGSVSRISAVADETTKSVSVTVQIPNPEYTIKPGVAGFVTIRSMHTAPVVPSAAVLHRNGTTKIFVEQDGKAFLRRIVVGGQVDNNYIKVEDGLENGEQVVIYGSQHLEDGEKVDIDWKRWSGRSTVEQAAVAK